MQSEIFEKDLFFTDFDVSSKQANKTSSHVGKENWLRAFGVPKNVQTIKHLEVFKGPIIYYLENGEQYNKHEHKNVQNNPLKAKHAALFESLSVTN